jgi:hypothetical protein
VKEAGLEGWATHLPPWAGQDLHVIFFLQLAKHIWYSTGSSFVRPSVSEIRANINKNGQQTMPYWKGKGTL